MRALMLFTVLLAAFFAVGADDNYRWQDCPNDDPPQALLWHGKNQVGNYRADTGEFFRRLPNGGFEETASTPPFELPEALRKKHCNCCKDCLCLKVKCKCDKDKHCKPDCKCGVKVIDGSPEKPMPVKEDPDKTPVKLEDGVPNFGVTLSEISPREKFTVGDREVTRETVDKMLSETVGAPGLPDDGSKLTIAVISDNPAVLDAAKRDMESPALAPFRAASVQQFYDLNGPERPMLNCGFVDKGTQVIVQSGNRVLWNDFTEGYKGLPTLLAAAYCDGVVREIRKVDPAYDRAKDPGPHNPGIVSGGIDVLLWVLGGFVGLLCPFFVLVVFVLGIVALYRMVRPIEEKEEGE